MPIGGGAACNTADRASAIGAIALKKKAERDVLRGERVKKILRKAEFQSFKKQWCSGDDVGKPHVVKGTVDKAVLGTGGTAESSAGMSRSCGKNARIHTLRSLQDASIK